MNYYGIEDEKMTVKGIILNCLGAILVLGCFWGFFMAASAYEDHVKCMNGAHEYCIESDFQ